MQAMVKAALITLREQKEAGLSGESVEATLARILGVEARGDGSWHIQIASDGLNLAAKATIERGLKAVLGKDGAQASVHFKRLQPLSPSQQPQAPLPTAPAQRSAPFGLSIDRRAIPGVTTILAVASGKGGVGKSTVSVNLAVALAAAGAKVGLLDADIYGPSVPLMLGLSGQQPIVEQDKLRPLTAHGVKTISFGFLTNTEQPVIWRGPLLGKAFKQLCYDVEWGELDYLVIDLPPGTGDIQLTMIETLPVHAALIVTTPQDIALLDAHKALTMFERLEVPVLGLVENMSQFICPCCGHAEAIFGTGGAGRMAAQRHTQVLVQVPLTAAVRHGGDAGLPVACGDGVLASPFHQLAAHVKAHVQ
jgi:ATP-binding protein involved in chromosome partitioning